MKKVAMFAVFAAVALMSLSCSSADTDKKTNSKKCKTCGSLENVSIERVG